MPTTRLAGLADLCMANPTLQIAAATLRLGHARRFRRDRNLPTDAPT